jgi:hypothetical protein
MLNSIAGTAHPEGMIPSGAFTERHTSDGIHSVLIAKKTELLQEQPTSIILFRLRGKAILCSGNQAITLKDVTHVIVERRQASKNALIDKNIRRMKGMKGENASEMVMIIMPDGEPIGAHKSELAEEVRYLKSQIKSICDKSKALSEDDLYKLALLAHEGKNADVREMLDEVNKMLCNALIFLKSI